MTSLLHEIRQRGHSAVVGKILVQRFEPALIPSRVPTRTKKIRAHVVIDAVNDPAARIEEADCFRADQTAAAGDDCPFQDGGPGCALSHAARLRS